MANIRLRLPPDPIPPPKSATEIADKDGICDGRCNAHHGAKICGNEGGDG